jgi:hypothetical protein
MKLMNQWILVLSGCLLQGCAQTQTQLDDLWRTVDPAGHGRSHREHYYPNESKTGLKLPKGAGDFD